ncbi:MAG: hypothetical protein ACK5ZW_12690 [Betaproteobacteria bacterium]|jgi:hypothetical protein|nr:hypothetical protein [Betaproteobacteria bacterium]
MVVVASSLAVFAQLNPAGTTGRNNSDTRPEANCRSKNSQFVLARQTANAPIGLPLTLQHL